MLSGAGGNTATKTRQAEKLIPDLLADRKELASEEIVSDKIKRLILNDSEKNS